MVGSETFQLNKNVFAVLVGSMFISMLGMGIISPFLPTYANILSR